MKLVRRVLCSVFAIGALATAPSAWGDSGRRALDLSSVASLDGPIDRDGDGVSDSVDNCPSTPNPQQLDSDWDGVGDACDGCALDTANDVDGDIVCGDVDNCPVNVNASQADSDADGVGDPCDNCPIVPNSGQADSNSNGIGDTCDGIVVQIPVVDQDIRSNGATSSQHFQQSSSRLGQRFAVKYRTLAWADVSIIPSGANIVSVTLVYHTTSGDPMNIDGNGDEPPQGGPINVEVHEVLRPWNYDEPLTYPASLTDNDVAVGAGETAWRDSANPDRWAVAGAGGATDSGPTVASTVVTSTIDMRFEFRSPDLDAVVQRWVGGAATNHGLMLRAIDADENSAVNNRKILCGKGFPLETSTTLSPAVAQSHRPYLEIQYVSFDTGGARSPGRRSPPAALVSEEPPALDLAVRQP